MSTLVAQTISNGTVSTSSENVIQGSAKAWANFNGTGTVAIRASYNVSSITDNGTGDYTVNFTNAFADVNYSTVLTGGNSGGIVATMADGSTAPTTSAVRIRTANSSFVLTDQAITNVAIFR
jgi:hypothetical protein